MASNSGYIELSKLNNELNPTISSNTPGPVDASEFLNQQNMQEVQNNLISNMGGDNNAMSQAQLQNAMASAINAFRQPQCDEECEKDKKKWELLYQLYILEETKKQSPKLINDLEQQYYEITDDDDWYRRWKENRVTRDTNESTEKLKKYHETSYTNLMTDLHNYNAQYTYLDKLGVLTSTYEELNEKMDKENKDLVNVKNTNFRKAEYEQGYSENYVRVNNFLYKFYWGLVLFYVFYFILMNKRYKDTRLWRITIILVLFPFVVSYLHKILSYVIEKVLPYLGF